MRQLQRPGLRPGAPGRRGELLFCAHHARQHEEALRSIGAEIHDESERLLVAPAVPAEER